MENNHSVQILKHARKHRYGVVSVVVYSAEGAVATVRAAEAKRSPAMLLVFPWAFKVFGGSFIVLLSDLCKRATVPISVHLDHCLDEKDVLEAMEMPFDSIMIDMSHFELDENMQKTSKYNKMCHARGIATEAETGRINGGEDGIKDTAELEGLLTDPEFAKDFASETGVDFLAPAFGNLHGEYPRKKDGSGIDARLDFERLDAIQAACPNVQIVLHGTNDFPDELLRECIRHLIVKVNVNKWVMAEYNEWMVSQTGKTVITKLVEGSIDAFRRGVEHCMDVCGSTNMADV